MASLLRRFWRSYEARLTRAPLPTKMLTSCTLMTAGDCAAQWGTRDESACGGPWDWRRTASMGAMGLMVHAPYFHCWYKYVLDARFIGSASGTVLQKVVIECTTAGPLYLTIALGWGATISRVGSYIATPCLLPVLLSTPFVAVIRLGRAG